MSDSRVLGEESELSERASKVINDLRITLDRWDNRLTLQNLSLAKRYVEGEFGIHAHIRHRVDGQEYCALFNNKCATAGPGHKEPFPRRNEPGVCRSVDLKSGESVCNQHHRVMLVGIIETPDVPERVLFPERVGTLEDVHSDFASALFFSIKSGFRFLGIREEGKAVMPPATQPIDGPLPHVVEGDSEVVDSVSGYRPPSGGNLLTNLDEVCRTEMSLVIRLTDKSIWASFTKGGDLGFEVTDVFVGPVNLDLAAGRPITHEET
jgi:hypothetical protein